MAVAERSLLRIDGAARAGPRPALLAVAGDSASGKSTIARGVERILGSGRVTRICVDDYHRFDRRTRGSLGITPLHPHANDLDRMGEDLRRLALGESIDKPVYDHATGELGEPERIEPREIVIVEGLLPFGDRSLRDRFDLSVYLEPEEELRHRWKIERDCEERGYDIREVVDGLRRRERDAERFVRPQREAADIVVAFHRRSAADPFGELAATIEFRSLPPHPVRELIAALGDQGRVRIVGVRPASRRAGVVEIDREALTLTQVLMACHLAGALGGAVEL